MKVSLNAAVQKEDPYTCAQTPLFEARGSTPMLAHMMWNWALKAGSFRISSLHA